MRGRCGKIPKFADEAGSCGGGQRKAGNGVYLVN